MLLEQVDAAEVADRVGDPGADDVRGRADRDDGEERVLASATLKPANSIVASEGIGMQALSPTMSRKIAGEPHGVDDVDGELDERVGDGREDEHGRALRVDGALRPVGSMRGSVSEVIRCFARGGGRRMSVFGPQHLQDHDRLVDVRAPRGPVRDLVGARAAAATSARAPATISSPLRARSSRAAVDERARAPRR